MTHLQIGILFFKYFLTTRNKVYNLPESVKFSKVQNGEQDLKTHQPKHCFC